MAHTSSGNAAGAWSALESERKQVTVRAVPPRLPGEGPADDRGNNHAPEHPRA
jgi:hypothetical protein